MSLISQTPLRWQQWSVGLRGHLARIWPPLGLWHRATMHTTKTEQITGYQTVQMKLVCMIILYIERYANNKPNNHRGFILLRSCACNYWGNLVTKCYKAPPWIVCLAMLSVHLLQTVCCYPTATSLIRQIQWRRWLSTVLVRDCKNKSICPGPHLPFMNEPPGL